MKSHLSIAMLSHMASTASPTGAERSLALLARGLHERGHQVRVVVPGDWTLAAELQAAGVVIQRVPARVCWLAYHDPRPWPVALAKWARFAWPDAGAERLKRLLQTAELDLVHVNCLPHLRGARAAMEAGPPVIWHLREILPPGARRRWFAARLRRYATRIVAVSEAVGQWVRSEGLGGRLDVIPNGVTVAKTTDDPTEARNGLGIPASGCLIGLFGQLLPHKGGSEFVRAAAVALRKNSDLRFVLAGPGPQGYLDRLRREIGEAGSADRIQLLPPQPSAERLLAAADAVCLATTTPDPLPRSILEAMAAGVPTVAFRSGGAPELVLDGETGLLVDPGDLEGLAREFVRLGEDPALRARLGQAARRRATECFSLDLHLDRMEETFLKVAAA